MQVPHTLSFSGKDIRVISTLPTSMAEQLSPVTLAAMSGAPDGSTVHLTVVTGKIAIDVVHPSIEYMRRQIYFRDGKGICLVNQRVRIHKEARGSKFLARSLVSQVKAIDCLELHPSLQEVGFDTQVAQKDPEEGDDLTDIGYVLLPRIGFNSEIPNLPEFRKQFPNCRATLLSDVAASPTLRSWWTQVGHEYDFTLSFDLAKESLSRKYLDAYMQETLSVPAHDSSP